MAGKRQITYSVDRADSSMEIRKYWLKTGSRFRNYVMVTIWGNEVQNIVHHHTEYGVRHCDDYRAMGTISVGLELDNETVRFIRDILNWSHH